MVGDREKIPVRYSYAGQIDGFKPFISDLYYAGIYNKAGEFCSWDTNNNNKFGELNKDEMIDELDLYPDVYIGRLPCSDMSEVTIVVNKIIEYEESTYGKEWFKDIILCGGDTYCSLALKILNLFIETKGFEGELVCDEVKQIMSDFNPIKLYASAILSLFGTTDKVFPSYDNINKTINDGAGFVLFSGHGTHDAWMTNSPIFQNLLCSFTCYQSYLINELKNGDKLPIIFMDACSCGDFSETTGI